jgi:hypothetical protein
MKVKKSKETLRIDPYRIREMIRSYYNMASKDSTMYQAYANGYNMLYDDLKRTKSFENPESFHVIVEKAGNNIQKLYQRSAANCEQIGVFSSHFLAELSKNIDEAEAEVKVFLTCIYNTWLNAINNRHINEGIELIRMQTLMVENSLLKQYKVPIFGNILTLVLGSISRIEQKIISAAKKYRTFQGLSNAHSYALEEGRLIPLDDYLKNVQQIDKALSWYGPRHKGVNELFTYGHSLDVSKKIRFANLIDSKGKSSSEAYDIISIELTEMGLEAEKEMPNEPKNLIDQTNRYKRKRIKELRKLNKNNK